MPERLSGFDATAGARPIPPKAPDHDQRPAANRAVPRTRRVLRLTR
ncbi:MULTISPECIES: hypothetical protein [Frankia]|nr:MULTISPECIES: hypothetical protein [Frankia]